MRFVHHLQPRLDNVWLLYIELRKLTTGFVSGRMRPCILVGAMQSYDAAFNASLWPAVEPEFGHKTMLRGVQLKTHIR
ncbi:Osmotin-like protein [Trichinella pseudospiralis]